MSTAQMNDSLLPSAQPATSTNVVPVQPAGMSRTDDKRSNYTRNNSMGGRADYCFGGDALGSLEGIAFAVAMGEMCAPYCQTPAENAIPVCNSSDPGCCCCSNCSAQACGRSASTVLMMGVGAAACFFGAAYFGVTSPYWLAGAATGGSVVSNANSCAIRNGCPDGGPRLFDGEYTPIHEETPVTVIATRATPSSSAVSK